MKGACQFSFRGETNRAEAKEIRVVHENAHGTLLGPLAELLASHFRRSVFCSNIDKKVLDMTERAQAKPSMLWMINRTALQVASGCIYINLFFLQLSLLTPRGMYGRGSWPGCIWCSTIFSLQIRTTVVRTHIFFCHCSPWLSSPLFVRPHELTSQLPVC